MSLIRQIWLLLWGSLLLAWVGGVAVNITVTRDTLQTQLAIKNTDSANALALVLSQQKGDAQLMGLVVASQFDTDARSSGGTGGCARLVCGGLAHPSVGRGGANFGRLARPGCGGSHQPRGLCA
jgi:hypothetical protein